MKKDNNSNEIPEMSLDSKYSKKKPAVSADTNQIQKETDGAKKDLEKIKNFILKKYSFTEAIGILPPQAIPHFVDEEEVPKETEKFVHLYMVIPEKKFKEIPKIKKEIVAQIDSMKIKQKIWLQIKTSVDIWENCLDSKFELSGAIALSYPLYDKGILGALRVAEIHKSLVVQKFDKYVVSYCIGGSLVRGEAIKTSDVDVFIIINDTDVKRMPRLELKERLRGMIYQYVSEAAHLAGVQNKLSPQIYLLTDFWESVKDAHPVIFTFIRDGIPLYDKGTFMPWKALLKMGKLKPSPEAIDMYMSMGENAMKRAKRGMLDVVIQDIFYGVSTPTQALLMLYGLPPTTHKETAKEFRNIFVNKEKIIEKKYADYLDEVIIKYYKGYEHEKVKEVSGAELDKLLKGMQEYLKRLGELREQIEKRSQEETIDRIYNDIINLLQAMFGKKTQISLVEEFEKLVKKGQFTNQHFKILKGVISVKKLKKGKGKTNLHKVNEARKNAQILINALIEYNQRCELVSKDGKK